MATSKGKTKDYHKVNGKLTIPAGSLTGTIRITTSSDDVNEPEEYFELVISRVNAVLPCNYSGRVIILNETSTVNQQENRNSIHAKEFPIADEQSTSKLHVHVLPNPTAHYFTLVFQSNKNNIVTIKVTDAVGRLVEFKRGLYSNSTLQIGHDYRPGVYYAEVIQGSGRFIVKLVKLSN